MPPSTLSLLGLIRHMARVEHNWFQRSLQGHRDAAPAVLVRGGPGPGLQRRGRGPGAWSRRRSPQWRAQIAAADEWLDGRRSTWAPIVPYAARRATASVRDILIHMIEEYARHCGHADLLRECIDGRTGQ